MSYTKFHDPWTNSDPISAEALNHIEGQYTAISAMITSHHHDSRYPTKTTADVTYFSTSYYTGFDADKLDGYHRSDLVSTVLPIGAIMLWSGTDSGLPDGWYVCDGTTHNGYTTPNLTERFVIGAGGSYSPGATGGPATWNGTITPAGSVTVGNHVLTTAELPVHSHSYEERYNPPTTQNGQVDTGTRYQTIASRSTNILAQDEGSPGGSHGHTGSSITLSAIDPRPSYYSLYYIMKCA